METTYYTLTASQLARVPLTNWEEKREALLDIWKEATEEELLDKVHPLDPKTLAEVAPEESAKIAQKISNVLQSDYDAIFETIPIDNNGKTKIGVTNDIHEYGTFDSLDFTAFPSRLATSVLYFDVNWEFHKPVQFFIPDPYGRGYTRWSDPDPREGYIYVWPSSLAFSIKATHFPGASPSKLILSTYTI